jgi:micrococcal nuclease
MNRAFQICVLAVLLACPTLDAKTRPAHERHVAPTFDATIATVDDGDTYWLRKSDNTKVKVRLHFADAPEIAHSDKEQDQPGGQEALMYVADMWAGRKVTVTQHGVSYDRPIVDIIAKDSGKSLAMDLVSAGLAELDPRFHPPAALLEAEKKARDSKLGVWANKDRVDPWDWRKQSRNKPK